MESKVGRYLEERRMIERRNSLRIVPEDLWVREETGDFTYIYRAKNIAEEGIYLESKMRTDTQDYISRLSFVLPNGQVLKNVTAKMIREDFAKNKAGAAFMFVNLNEESRFKLREYFMNAGSTLAKSLP